MAALRRSYPELALLLVLLAACDARDDQPRMRSTARKSGDGGQHGPRASTAPATPLAITVDGRDGPAWTGDAFGRVESWSVAGDSGVPRLVWSLPRLASELIGPRARVARLHGRDGPLDISAAQWSASEPIPALRRTGRGELKFQWVDAQGRPRLDRPELPGVIRIELVVDE